METYTSYKVLINNLKAVSDFVDITSRFCCDIEISSDNELYLDAKTIILILGLNILEPLYVRLFTTDKSEIDRFTKSIERFICK